MNIRNITLYLFLLLYVSGCIGIEPKEDPVKKNIDNLRQDLTIQQQKINSLEKEKTAKTDLEAIKAMLNLNNEAVQRQKADFNASLDRLNEEIASLRGKIEETQQSVKKTNEDLDSIKDTKEKSIDKKEFNNKLSSLQGQLSAIEKRLSLLSEKIVSLENSQTMSAADNAGNQSNKQEAKTTISDSPDALYNESLKLTNEKDYDNALEKFGKFLDLFPKHELASNAQYWIAEIYYSQKDYERAVLEFNEVLTKYPKSEKAPAALFKQGKAFSELGNKKEAKLIFIKVAEKYPKTKEADAAKKILEETK